MSLSNGVKTVYFLAYGERSLKVPYHSRKMLGDVSPDVRGNCSADNSVRMVVFNIRPRIGRKMDRNGCTGAFNGKSPSASQVQMLHCWQR